MPELKCPNCRALMTDPEIAHGWCEACGGKIPVFAYKEAGIEVPSPPEPPRETPAPRPLTFAEQMVQTEGQSVLFGIILFIYFMVALWLGFNKETIYLSLIPIAIIAVVFFFIGSLFRRRKKK